MKKKDITVYNKQTNTPQSLKQNNTSTMYQPIPCRLLVPLHPSPPLVPLPPNHPSACSYQ